MKKPVNKWLSLIPLACVIAGAVYFYDQARTEAVFLGLPTIPCFDPTQPVVQSYSLRIGITVDGSASAFAVDRPRSRQMFAGRPHERRERFGVR